jgi:hypothetical protein
MMASDRPLRDHLRRACRDLGPALRAPPGRCAKVVATGRTNPHSHASTTLADGRHPRGEEHTWRDRGRGQPRPARRRAVPCLLHPRCLGSDGVGPLVLIDLEPRPVRLPCQFLEAVRVRGAGVGEAGGRGCAGARDGDERRPEAQGARGVRGPAGAERAPPRGQAVRRTPDGERCALDPAETSRPYHRQRERHRGAEAEEQPFHTASVETRGCTAAPHSGHRPLALAVRS